MDCCWSYSLSHISSFLFMFSQFHVFVLFTLCTCLWLFYSSCSSCFSPAVVSWLLNLSVGFLLQCLLFIQKKILFVVTFKNTLLSSCSCFMTSIPSFANSLNNFNVLIFIHCFQIVLFLACWGQILRIFASTDCLISVCILV